MHPWKSKVACIGACVLAFGAGLLLSLFLPEGFLVVLEAVVILALGIVCFSAK